MSRFYVGQRVRLVRPTKPKNMGATDVIKSMFDCVRLTSRGIPTNCDVAWDVLLSPCEISWHHTDNLEPITDCYDLSTWDQCVWQPEELEVTV